jgi:hypothetical protein
LCRNRARYGRVVASLLINAVFVSAAGAMDCVHDGSEVGSVDSGLRIVQHFGDEFAAQNPAEQPCRCTADDGARLVHETFHAPAACLQRSAPLVRVGRSESISWLTITIV